MEKHDSSARGHARDSIPASSLLDTCPVWAARCVTVSCYIKVAALGLQSACYFPWVRSCCAVDLTRSAEAQGPSLGATVLTCNSISAHRFT